MRRHSRLVWAAPGRDTAILRRFFDALEAERAAQIAHVCAGAADWIADAVTVSCPNAIRYADFTVAVSHRGAGCRASPGVTGQPHR